MFQGVIREARGDDSNCANQMCKGAPAIYWCSEAFGVVYKNPDCLACNSLGRCVSPQNVACNDTDQEQFFAVTTVLLQCDCAKAPNDGAVEANADPASEWTDSERKQQACVPNNTGSGI